MGNENTHVANASRGEIRIYFQSEKLHLKEIIIDVFTEAGVSVKDNVEAYQKNGTKLHVVLQPDTRIQFIRCSSGEFINIPCQGDLYVTVTCNRGSKNELICNNMRVPSDRSIIVTDSGMVKFAKYGKLWEDEDGRQWP
ncbi:uncharacterized protein RB166_001008 [Leptodactylus fuscus]